MDRWKRSVCGLLLLALLLGLCPGAGAAADGSDIIFLALNDAMPYGLAAGTMPYWSGGVLYVHSTTFNITSLNLSASYNAGNMTLLLYSGTSRRSLTFYLADGYVQTQSGATDEVTAAMRGDQVFLPLDYCASFFGIGVAYLTSLKGWPLVRLTTGAQVWEDAFFEEQADKLINERADKYMESFVSTSSPGTTTDTPDSPSTVDPPNSSSIDPSTEEPNDNPGEDPATTPLTVYLALVGMEAVQAALPLLDTHTLSVAIYLDAGDILSNGDLVRQLYAAGHCIGVTGDLSTANDALDLVLCRRSLMTLDVSDDAFLSHYSTHNALTLESAGEEPILLRLEDDTAGDTLTWLLEQQAMFLPLRETTALFRTAPEPPAVLTE